MLCEADKDFSDGCFVRGGQNISERTNLARTLTRKVNRWNATSVRTIPKKKKKRKEKKNKKKKKKKKKKEKIRDQLVTSGEGSNHTPMGGITPGGDGALSAVGTLEV